MSAAGEPDELDEAARKIFSGPIAFLKSAPSLKFLPDPVVEEIAFAGRSNVGKSSLINALVNRHGLARASTEPGRTREVNFFVIAERLRLVDLPGYGFAKASKTEVKKFQNLGRAYLRGRPNLKRVYLLIDARHGLKANDTGVLDGLDTAAVSYQIVLTKGDGLKPGALEKRVAETEAAIRRRPAAFPLVQPTSSRASLGVPELRASIARLLAERGSAA